MSGQANLAFAHTEDLHAWLADHHMTSKELWVRIYKKGSGIQSIDWNDCVLVALSWGWIDGIKRSLGADAYVQRLTPRRPRSTWSKRNCLNAEQLIAEKLMQPAGLAEVEAAKRDGRWQNAYDGSASFELPQDFQDALRQNHLAQYYFEALKRTERYQIYRALKIIKRAEARTLRIAAIVAKLASNDGYI